MTITQAVLAIPTFCWQTMAEIVTYAEQINDNLQYHSVSPTLKELVKRGYLEVKRVPKSHGRGGPMMVNMYRRKEEDPVPRPRCGLRPDYARAP